MKANEFVKEEGIEKAKYALKNNPDLMNIEFFKNLKRLVESHELVEKFKNRHGGIRHRIRWGMFRYGDTPEFNSRLKQAIADVESCL